MNHLEVRFHLLPISIQVLGEGFVRHYRAKEHVKVLEGELGAVFIIELEQVVEVELTTGSMMLDDNHYEHAGEVS